jgi:hypothetical protein
VRNYFAGMFHVFWPSLTCFYELALELCAGLYFLMLSAPLVRETAPATPHAIHIFFVGLLPIFWSSLACFGERVHEIFTQLHFLQIPRRRCAKPRQARSTRCGTASQVCFTFSYQV